MSYPSDAVIIGPGIWYTIHKKAYLAINARSKQEFIDYMMWLREYFPCTKCRNHIIEYIDTHPLESQWHLRLSNGRDIGMFSWSWLFHNAVNLRLEKPQMPFETAYHLYSDDAIIPCGAGCDEEVVKTPIPRSVSPVMGSRANPYLWQR